MYYLKDHKTGERYELSSKKILFARTIPTISLVIYGIVFVLIFNSIELSIQVSILLLAVAYIIELVLCFSKKHSGGNFIGAVLLLILWRNTFSQIFNHNNLRKPTVSSGKINEVVKLYKSCENNAMFSI